MMGNVKRVEKFQEIAFWNIGGRKQTGKPVT